VLGDVGLVIAAFLLFDKTGSLDYLGIFHGLDDAFSRNDGTLVAAGLLILLGAFAKSAQLPLHTWLPDAMEGPTPVSALIHAATMVTAGVYLIARMHPIFELAPTAADVSAIIGTATLVFAASVALTVTDLKRVIAYSTISQIGYMVLGVSVAAYGAGLFHLMTHAFFKALLFMCAGSVIAAMAGSQDLDRMGGFRKAMPFTFAAFTIGSLALAGFPLMSGFFSKDEILAFTLHRGGLYVVLGVFGYLAAGLTAFYAFRLVFRVFYGDPVPEALEMEAGGLAHHDPENPLTGEPEDTDVGFPGPEHHVAERAGAMRAAMGPLALLAIVGGVLSVPGVTDTIEHFLEPTFEDSRFHDTAPTDGAELLGLVVGGLVSIAGIAAAYHVYVRRPGLAGQVRERFAGLHRFLVNKWYFDELFDLLFVRTFRRAGEFGRQVVETEFVQDTIVGGATGVVRAGTTLARAVQTGYVRAYALLLLAGLGGLALYFLISST
jgi:NADH-quinone oxidoreductase subunit L